MHKFKRYSWNDKAFYIITILILTIFFIMVLYPCIFVVSASFSSGTAVQAGKVVLFPVDFSLEGYKTVFNTKTVWIGFANSLFYTFVGTAINVAMTMTAGYCLSRKDLPGRNGIMLLFTFTMFFSGGLIPSYMVIQNLKMINTRWALLIPGAIGVYNLIVCRTFIINTIPTELLEAYFNAMIYLHDKALYPLTLFLREILMASQIDPSTVQDPELQARLQDMVGVIKYALIMVSMIPVLLIYPFVQKYFVKGVMIGSVKG